MAEIIGVDRFVMSKWLGGKRRPSNKYLLKMSSVTGQNFLRLMREWEPRE
jgi:hypothetical protein